MGDTILLRRGTLANLPALQAGEPGWSEDSNQLYIGTATGSAASAMPIGDYDYAPESFTQASIETILTLIGTTNKRTLLLRPGAWAISTPLVIPANVTLDMPAGAYFVISGTGAVTGLKEATPEMWGFSSTPANATQYTLNMTAIQAAIDSGAAKVTLPKGTYSYGTAASSTGITIDRTIRVDGSGSCEDNGTAGSSTTKLTYIGTGIGVDLIGSFGANGTENIHLSNFSLGGNNGATGGIYAGSGINLTKSSLKNIHISGFTKASGHGLRVGNCLETLFENVYAQGNWMGIDLDGDSTTLLFINCWARSGTKYGWYIVDVGGASFINCLAEANAEEGLMIFSGNVSKLNFFNWHSEGNNTATTAKALTIAGTAVVGSPSYINFYGGTFAETLPAFNLNYATNIVWYDPVISGYSAGFMVVTGNTIACQFYSSTAGKYQTDITGNHLYGVKFNSDGNVPSRYISAVLSTAEKATLPYTSGIFMLRDVVNHTAAIFSLNGSANTTTLLSANSATYTNTLNNATTCNVAWDATAYKIQNNLVGANVQIIADSLLVDTE